jgi:hypothetical protein
MFVIFLLLFFLLSIAGSLIFPQYLISQWIGGKQFISLGNYLVQILRTSQPISFRTIWGIAIQDLIIKYAALSSSILTSIFILDYGKDEEMIAAQLQTGNENLNKWLTLICAYKSLIMRYYQQIGDVRVNNGKQTTSKTPIIAPIILRPNAEITVQINNVIAQLEKGFIQKGFLQKRFAYQYLCLFILSAEDFLKSPPDILYFGGESNEISIEMIRNNSKATRSWVWLKKKGGNIELHAFDDFDIACQWVVSMSEELG